MEIIGGIAAVLGILYIWVKITQAGIEETNAKIEAEMGDAYNPDLAGKPWHAVMIVVGALVLTIVLFGIVGDLALRMK